MRKLIVWFIIFSLCSGVAFAVWDIGTTGLEAYWTFDDADTTGTNSIEYNLVYNGTIDGADTGVDGMIGEAYKFVLANTDEVNIINGNNLNMGTGNFTLCFWYNSTSDATNQVGFFWGRGAGGEDSFQMWIDTNHDIIWRTYDGAAESKVTAAGTYDDGSWYHFCGVRDSNMTIYIDGSVAVTATADVRDLAVTDDGAAIGRWEDPTYYFDGVIDEVGLWNRSLNQTQVFHLHNSGSPGAEQQPPFTAADTCTAPGSGNWAVTCSDACVWSSAQDVPGNITATGSGILSLSDIFTFTGSNQRVNIGSGCSLETSSGGGFNG